MTMNGQEIYKAAVKTMAAHSDKVIKDSGKTMDDVDWFIPHQAICALSKLWEVALISLLKKSSSMLINTRILLLQLFLWRWMNPSALEKLSAETIFY